MVSSLLFLGAEFTGVQQLACVILLWVGHVVFMYMCVMSNMYEVGGRILMDGVGRWMESEDNLPGLSEPALTTNSPTSYLLLSISMDGIKRRLPIFFFFLIRYL